MPSSKNLTGASLWMMAGTGVMNLSMVLYHRLSSVSLGQEYAQLAVLVGVANLAGTVTNGLSTYLTKLFARDAALCGKGAVKTRLISLMARMSLVLAACAAGLMILGPWVVSFLKLPSLGLYGMVVALTLVGLGLAVIRGALQGLHSFWVLGSTLMVEGMGRTGFAAMLVWNGWGVYGALGGSLLGGLVGAASCVPGLRGLGPKVPTAPPPLGREKMRQRVLELGGDTLALGFFSLLCFLDIMIFKHYQAEAEAALYSRAAMVAKSFLYAATAINLVALPVVAAARAKGLDTRPLLLKFLGAMLAIEALGAVFVWCFTDLTIALLCGNQPEFLKLAPLVRWFCLAVVPLALYQLVLLYQLAVGVRGTLVWETAVIVIYGVLLYLFHSTMGQVVTCLGFVAVLGLAGALVISLIFPGSSGGALSPEESAALALQEGVEAT